MALLGCINKSERWGLTIRGWLALLGVTGGLAVWCIMKLHPFLAAPEETPRGSLLVVEGWINDYAIKEAFEEFQSHDYALLITTGGPLVTGHLLVEHDNYAQVAAASLKKMGLDPKRLVAVPAASSKRTRTYQSALNLGEWLQENPPGNQSITVFTQGTHARRSLLLFRMALPDTIQVGVLSATTRAYDPQRWWLSSQGVRTVIGETIAFTYSRFLFRP